MGTPVSALVDASVIARFGLNPKDERYTRPATKAWCLERMHLEQYTLDVAGCPESHLAPRWFGLQLDGSFVDGLARAWSGDVWCNPPFSLWEAFLSKAWREWRRGGCRSISLIITNDKTEQDAWQNDVAPHRDRRGSPLRTFELAKRTRFSAPGLGGRPIKGSLWAGCYLLGWHRRFLRGSP